MSEQTPRAAVVDDNLMFGMMVVPALREEGYEVRSFSGRPGDEEQLAGWGPAVIFVNLTSTRYAGPELVRALRARPELARTPIVGYAGHVERHFFQEGRDAGADLVVPNSAVRKSIPEVLAKLRRRLAGDAEEWPDEE